ncbi:MAG: hypothetical protein RIT43_928 [Bacteroidota bacterium]|jgi:uncharacterized membrane protein YbhN (UPF0104 family)
MLNKTVLTLVKTVLPLLLGVYLIWYFFASMDKKALELFYKALYEANYFWIILSLILGYIAYLSRAWRWGLVLEPLGYTTNFWNRYHAIMIGYIVNLTIPRAGEASRSAMLYRSDGVPFSNSFGTVIAERAIDLIMLLGVTLLTAFMGLSDFMEIKRRIEEEFSGPQNVQNSWWSWSGLLYSAILCIVLVFIYLFVFKPGFRKKLTDFIKEVLTGVWSVFKCKNPWSYVVHSLIIWFCYIIMFILPFYALEETKDVPLEGMLFAFIAGSLGITLTNGGIGTYPLLVGLVVTYYIQGEQGDNALAIGNALGMLIWATQTVLMIALGLLSLVLLPKNYSQENENA